MSTYADDPFAIFCIAILIITVPVALILLTVTARRSVHSIFDRNRHKAQYRLHLRAVRNPILPVEAGLSPLPPKRSTKKEKNASVKRPESLEESESAPMLSSVTSTKTAELADPSFEETYDGWYRAQNLPLVVVTLEEDDGKQR